jgi:hypothetical protein
MSELRRLVDGYRATQVIYVAMQLGLPDLLDGARTADELAELSGAHPDTLYRLLRGLAGLGIVREESGRVFALTELGEPLRSDAPGSLAGWAAFVGRPSYWQAWGALEHSVRTGENAFRHVFGTDVWSWRAEHPEESAIFDRAMAAITAQVNDSLLNAHDFARYGSVVDVGGGNGALLLGLLEAHERLRGVLFDQAHVVAAAPEHERLDVVAGSFFESVPEGGDAYVLKAIVHDWEDEEAVAILRVVRKAMPDGAALLVIERVLGDSNEDRDGVFSDLNMLVMPGGRERTLDEYAALFSSAGFRLVGATPTPPGWNVIEAAPA